MTDQQWTQAMAYYGALWKQSIPSEAEASAWRTVYGDEPQDAVLAALRLLASQFGRRFGPAPGEVTQALDQLRRPKPEPFAAPELPASTDPVVTGNRRRRRVLSKLAGGALTRDGDAAEGWDDDGDLWAFDADPLIEQMHRAHLEVRNGYPTREQLTADHHARTAAARAAAAPSPPEGI